VTWACAWCLVLGISHKSKFVIYHPLNTLCHDKTVIQGATDLLQQPELCEQWTVYTSFHIMLAIHRSKFSIKIGEHFFPD
jgi:hypothetical protein